MRIKSLNIFVCILAISCSAPTDNNGQTGGYDTNFRRVYYDGNGSTSGSVPVDNLTYQKDALVTTMSCPVGLKKYGFAFSHWNTSADNSGTTRNPGDTFPRGTNPLTLFAQWKAIAPITVTYFGNGSINGTVPIDSQTYYPGDTITVKGNIGTLTQPNKFFQSWNTLADGSGTSYIPGNSFIISSTNVHLYAQWTTDFALTIGNSSPYSPTKMWDGLKDSTDHTYLLGNYTNAVDLSLGNGTDIRTGINDDTFLTKLNSDGSLAWTVSFGQTVDSSSGYAFASRKLIQDSSGNLLIFGSFSGTFKFDPNSTSSNKVAVGKGNAFLSKFNSDGNFISTRIFNVSADSLVTAMDMKKDSLGNIYLTGSFSGTVDFNPDGTADSKVAGTKSNAYLTKINANGTYGWTKVWGSTGSEDRGNAIAIDSTNNVYLVGSFGGTVNFNSDGGTDNQTNPVGSLGYNNGAFVLRINADGSYGWVRTYVFNATSINLITGEAISITTDDNLYVGGTVKGAVDLDPTGGVDQRTATGNSDIFLLKMSTAGSQIWAKMFGSTGETANPILSIDSTNNPYLSGTTSKDIDFLPGSPGFLVSVDKTNIARLPFILKINSS